MAPRAKVAAAYRAMADLGIDNSKVKPVLKKLLNLYNKDWSLIEEENYRALADAIFEDDEFKVLAPEQEMKNKQVNEEEMQREEVEMHVEPDRPLKRLRLREQESQPLHPVTINAPNSAASPSGDTLSGGNVRPEARSDPIRDAIVDKGKQPASPQVTLRGRNDITERASVPSKEPTVGPGKFLLTSNQMPHNYALVVPKDEPVDYSPEYEVPIAMIPPDEEPSSLRDSSMKNHNTGKQGVRITVSSSQLRSRVRDEDILPSSNEEAPSNVVIASSASGDVKLSLNCSSAPRGPAFRMPSREQFLKMMEDKCLRSYKISDPNFSVTKLLTDICDCMLEFSTDSNDESPEDSITRPSSDVLKESEVHDLLSVGRNKDLDMPSHPSNGSIHVSSFSALVSTRSPFSPSHQSSLDDAVPVSKMEDPVSPNSRSLVVVLQHQLTADDIRCFHDINDITKGEENVQISWVNETTSVFPSSFYYIPQNLVFQYANVNISLSRIGPDDCCLACMGNCSSLSTCPCLDKTGGGYVYTAEGLMKEEFLEACIAISRNPQQHYFYCNDCPLERSKNDGCLEPCKGHLKRKFIKECWSKCGCWKQCGNRVIQRGITCNLQVFFTSERKGWGLRTLEDLPKGAFVCEFIGEILTMKELHERNMKCTGKHTYPILLDAGWDKGFVKDEEALCLEAASFGNIARFINHRCFDANLVDIPVQIECPDRYYYHVAFFTSRKIAAKEELTWDYGIDFYDLDQPVELFQCRCGSKFCRNMKRSNRSTRSASFARS